MTEASPDPLPQTAPAVARAERRLARLERLADKGLAMAEATAEDGAKESAETFAKLSRAVRLTTTLEEKLDAALAARLAGVIPEIAGHKSSSGAKPDVDADVDADAALEDPYACLKTGRKGRARELLVDVVDHEIPDPVDHDTLLDALDERLLYDDAYENLDDISLRDVVEHLCRDLKLKPDWSRWLGEGWKPNPPFYRPRCSLFAAPSRVPILEDDDEPDPRQ